MSPESENESLLTVGQAVNPALFLSDSFVIQGEFHKCTCSSPPQNGSSNRRAVTVAGVSSTQGIGIRWQTSHKSRRSQQWRRTATRSQAWSLDSFFADPSPSSASYPPPQMSESLNPSLSLTLICQSLPTTL